MNWQNFQNNNNPIWVSFNCATSDEREEFLQILSAVHTDSLCANVEKSGKKCGLKRLRVAKDLLQKAIEEISESERWELCLKKGD